MARRFAFRKRAIVLTTALAAWPGEPASAQLQPNYRNISPFYGNISPFYGNISPFYGNISPFWGNISPFYGNIAPFSGTGGTTSFTQGWAGDPFWGTLGTINPKAPAYARIGDYWQAFGSTWQQAAPLWTDPARAGELSQRLSSLIAATETTWGTALLDATGKSFAEGIGRELFARYGIDPADGASLQRLSDNRRNQFLLDWYDTLMGYSGRDRIDHWMPTVRWNPALSQQQGLGASSIIGILDGRLSDDSDVRNNIAWQGGSTAQVMGHGVGVASLIVGGHDGVGVMGIAPNARIATYNPFDSTNTASWQDVATGVVALAGRGASVINMSLGVPGQTLGADVRNVLFDPNVTLATKGKTVFVVSAGNDGVAQTSNLAWQWLKDPALIVVGSTGVDGTISSFSNTPGTACLLSTLNLYCQEQLANRFIVAPGEMILMSDGMGGVVRRSGTSFAAPLVSGAITLLHDRWPWLAKYPTETVDIILRSARDLGAPGTDPVYGRGMLDVTASQAPLSFSNLTFYEVVNGNAVMRTADQVRSSGVKSTWEADGAFFVLFENIGATRRDFAVPLSSRLVGTVSINGGNQEQFQRFISQRFVDWIRRGVGFSDIAEARVGAPGGWQARWSMAAGGVSEPAFGRRRPEALTAFGLVDPSERLSITAGRGGGAAILGERDGFGLTSDYGREGGIDPLLGFAQGGTFLRSEFRLGTGTSVSFGFTSRTQAAEENEALSPAEQQLLRSLPDYRAKGQNFRIEQRIGGRLKASLALSRVSEGDALFGVQSSLPSDFEGGARSTTLTLGASLKLPGKTTLAGSATTGRTSVGRDGNGLRTDGAAIRTSAWALSATKDALFGSNDKLRISLAQPLHIDRGQLTYQSMEVVDRQTGEIGLVDRTFDIRSKTRRFTGEALYATPLFGGKVEGSSFARINLSKGGQTKVDDVVVGGRLSIGF
ncbi:hypothetical protein GCM10022281_02950 [Sphingomonas rosea]|uniref:Peptidase S8/S53 domain-containing protein n=1 Tax=Sphingomonas rosea TaxID=335605 RepID=A0ABP7TKI1_9SPHN